MKKDYLYLEPVREKLANALVKAGFTSVNKGVCNLFCNIYYLGRFENIVYGGESLDVIMVQLYLLFYSNIEYYVSCLTEKQKLVIRERFGLNSNGVMQTFSEVGNSLGCGRQNAKDISDRALNRILKECSFRIIDGRLFDKRGYNQYIKGQTSRGIY